MTSTQNLQLYEALLAQNQVPTAAPDFLRLRWKSFGSLETCIHVAAHGHDPPSAQDQAYSRPELHPIAALSLITPPVSSITVTQGDLDDWEDQWVDEHLPHADDHGAVWAGGDQEATETEDEDTKGDDGQGRTLMRCWDEDRPPAPAPRLVVTPSSKPCVTIHYVSAVHGWLQTHRDDILRARGVHESGPVPSDTAFYVNVLSLAAVTLDDGSGKADFSYLWSSVARAADGPVSSPASCPSGSHVVARLPPESWSLTPEMMASIPAVPLLCGAARDTLPGSPGSRCQRPGIRNAATYT